MYPLNIGVDIDNTVVNSNYKWWQWLELQTKAEIPWEEARKYQHLTIPYKDYIFKEEALDFWRSPSLYDDWEPIIDSRKVLQKFKDQGHNIVFISALKGNHHKSKVGFVKKYFSFYDAFLGTKEKEFVNVDVMIDDSNSILNRFTNVNTILIKYDNQDIQSEELHNRFSKRKTLYKCSDWYGILELYNSGEFDWRMS